MLISVIIPCFNAEKYIADCIESVLVQTYSDIEIICIDNNSSDATYHLLQEYEKKHPGKIFIEKESVKGAPAARNKGFSMAKGEWIQFLDADDLLLPTKIASQVSLIDDANPSIGFIAGNCFLRKIDGSSVLHYNFISKNIWDDLLSCNLGNTISNLWNSKSLMSIGVWDTNIKSSQEADLMFRLLKNGCKVIYDSNPLTINIEHSESVSKSNVEDNLLRYIDLRQQIYSYMQENHLSDSFTYNLFRVQYLFGLVTMANHNLNRANEEYLHKFKPLYLKDNDFSFVPNKIARGILKIIGFKAFIYVLKIRDSIA